MASIDKCYAVAAYNLVSEEHHHSHVMDLDFELLLTMQRLGCLIFTTSQAIATHDA
jgi:hypothetical protein